MLLKQDDEKSRVTRYKFDKDRRLALGSLLLQKAVISWTFGVIYQDIQIDRTGKLAREDYGIPSVC